MKKLIQGIIEFKKNLSGEERSLFAELALEQKPDALFIACSDSRVVPNLFASTNPGDLFVLRNIGNLIPPSPCEENSAPAAIEFSLFSLGVKDIIVCGHSECGAMKALIEGVDDSCCSHVSSWLKYGEPALQKIKEGFTLDSSLSELNQLSQVNVLQQVEHIKSYPFVREKCVNVHGWWFDIERAEVFRYEESLQKFVPIE